MTEQPLTEGEHVDLDTGTTVTRGGSVGTAYPENVYKVRDAEPDSWSTRSNQRSVVMLEDEEIRQLAELAGFEVRDR